VVRALATAGWWRRLGYDNFRDEPMFCAWDGPDAGQWMPLRDADMVDGRIALEQAGFEPVGRELMRDAVLKVARGGQFDSAQVWLERLRWDGRPRVAGFLERYCGAGAGEGGRPYAAAVSTYLWTALAGRVLDPGCQADMVPILVGAQGVGKTRGIEALAPFPDAYTTIDLSVRDADLARRMRGRLVVEIAELRGLHTRERTAIKDFVTQRADKWRPLYQEFAVAVPRRCLLVGSTNESEFLADETGNRRWLPVEVGAVDVAAVARDREQLWAEAAARWLAGGVAWAAAARLAAGEHEKFRIDDSLEVEVEEWLARRALQVDGEGGGSFAIRDVLIGCGFDPRSATPTLEQRFGKILKLMGFSKHNLRIENGRQAKRWIKRAALPCATSPLP
jgi:predicted P-loop ATPase